MKSGSYPTSSPPPSSHTHAPDRPIQLVGNHTLKNHNVASSTVSAAPPHFTDFLTLGCGFTTAVYQPCPPRRTSSPARASTATPSVQSAALIPATLAPLLRTPGTRPPPRGRCGRSSSMRSGRDRRGGGRGCPVAMRQRQPESPRPRGGSTRAECKLPRSSLRATTAGRHFGQSRCGPSRQGPFALAQRTHTGGVNTACRTTDQVPGDDVAARTIGSGPSRPLDPPARDPHHHQQHRQRRAAPLDRLADSGMGLHRGVAPHSGIPPSVRGRCGRSGRWGRG